MEKQITDRTTAYFSEMPDAPFADAAEELYWWSEFLNLLIAVSFDAVERDPGENLNRISSFMQDRDIAELYAPGGRTRFAGTEELYDLFLQLLENGLDEEGRPLSPLSRLLYVLSDYEKWLVILAFAGSRNAKYERLFGKLQEREKWQGVPTVGLAADLARFFLPGEEDGFGEDGLVSEDAYPYMPQSYFMRYLFESPDEDEAVQSLSRPLVLSDTAISYLSGELGEDSGHTGGAADDVTELLPEADLDEYIARKETIAELSALLSGGYEAFADVPLCVEICGERGSGRRFALTAAASVGRRVLSANAASLLVLTGDMRKKLCQDIVLKCLLYGWVLYLHNVPVENAAYEQELQEIFQRLQDGIPVICIASKKALPAVYADMLGGNHKRIVMPEVTADMQLALWQAFAADEGVKFPEDYDLRELVSRYSLNPGRIAGALYAAKLLMRDGGLAESASDDEQTADAEDGEIQMTDAGGDGMPTIDTGVLEEQIRLISSADFGDNATKLSSPFTWDDLVVGEQSRHLLTLACDRVRYSMTVNNQYGFGRKLPYGRGVAIVFYGPPGTGKTMAAQVVAKELNLDIFRVDLSQVSSKYIGETEKNLGAIFDAAKNSNAILFFDEADSLFSKRTEVSSSNDKYANAETSYLLQKIEEYAGVSILATNNMQNFDAAFKRRMTFLIPLEAPDEKTRQMLWEKAYPKEAPLSPEVNAEVLAKALELTGAQIKNIATESAYIAAAKGGDIDYEAIIEAADLECSKTGVLQAGQTLRSAIMSALY